MNTHCSHSIQRTIHVGGMSCEGCEEAIQRNLGASSGIFEVQADHHTGRVKVIYDLGATQIKTIEEKLAELGYPPDDGFLARGKRAWTYFTEQNRRDNLMHQGHCCNKPPRS
uniref:Copper chaperone CopZ n=1 Tax=Candidatus Kentrum sp. LPFa TaxID=2126335 RepID=A0A450XQ68_9GAMM|nr:MAG: Copper chaperone CopZ [Candidatus Kentron sp. LPFa]VFK31461.1 MAG: Copper chaperone CopZ [Candidatus Kentron sp. LPFa]